MPVSFQDLQELDALGYAAFYKLEATSNPPGYRGALFQITARGEPVEFTYNRIETPSTFLWRPADVRRAVARRLAQSLFTLCPQAPSLIFGLAEEIPLEVFTEDLEVVVVERASAYDEPVHVLWCVAAPAPGTPERLLAEQIMARRLLIEPFERAATGLAELYGDPIETA